MNKRARLADGFHRPSDDDNSSSGCSSAGPGALRNMMPSPISPPSGRSISGSLYGRPSPTEEHQLPMNRMLSSSRYLPYIIRPLVVRAKRKLQNDSNVHVTSTAQRIINALDNISTPVVNSAKIPYEPFLTSRPVFTPIRRDTQGPPIMKSPLVPSPHGKIMYNPTMHIPRMVDFGTNTDMTMSSLNTELLQDDAVSSPKGFGGGKMKSVSTRLHTAPLKTNFSTSVPAQVLQDNFIKEANVESKYKFSRAWSVKDLRGVQEKVESRDKPGKGVEPSMTVSNSGNGNGFISSMKPLPPKPPEGTQSSMKPLSALVNSNAGKSWDCPTCMVPNKLDAQVCVCCGAKNPTSAQTPAVVKGWDCPTCMVPNKPDVTSCVCCGEKNPNASAPKPLKNWDCPTCMVPNKPDAASCVCCNEKNPNKSALPPSTPASKTTFQFGFGSNTPKTAAADSTPAPSQPLPAFTFGAPKNTSTPTGMFTFGVKSDTQSTPSKVAGSSGAPTSSFSFGVPKLAETPKSSKVSESAVTSSAETSAKPFTFGSVNTAPTKPPVSPITFGLPAEPSAATAVKSSPSFSVPSKAPEAAFSPKAAVPLKSSDKQLILGQPNNGFGSFSFGSPKPSPQINAVSNSGLVKSDDELWQCKQCPARNRAVNKQCIGCAGPKPATDGKNMPQPSAGKRYHFDPFFGGKNEDKVDSYSESEPKRKVPGSGGSSFSSPSSTGFLYTPPTESTLKLKPAAEAPQSTQSSEIKSGSFLDALKTGSQFTFAAPAPGASLIPTGPSPTISSSSGISGRITAPASSSIPALPSAVSSTSSTIGPPSGLFQFGASSSMNNSSTPVPNLSLPGNNNALNQSTFSFGGMKNGPMQSSSAAAPPVFGSAMSAGTSSSSVFGAPVGNSLVSPTSPLGAAPTAAAATPAPTAPSFNLTPNFAFGGPSPASGSGSFVFQAQPSASPGGPPGDGGMGQRKIRRATRRMQPR